MKNIVKMVGIIAILAIIGLAVSCETDEKDQTTISGTDGGGTDGSGIDGSGTDGGGTDEKNKTNITITDFPSGANNKWAYIVLSKTKDGLADDQVAFAAVAKKISGGSFLNEMLDTKGEPYGDNDNFFVLVGIADTAAAAEFAAKSNPTIKSDSKKAVVKGNNTYSVTLFSPDVVELFGTADEIVSEFYAGSYTCNYINSTDQNKTEFVDLAADNFKIYEKIDNYVGDHLYFSITKGWTKVDVPTSLTGYTKGFKFTGIITEGEPVNGPEGPNPKSLYGYKSAPNFDANDITNKTEAWMFLYFNDDGNFVRTAFSKAGSDQSTFIITGKSENRVYTKTY